MIIETPIAGVDDLSDVSPHCRRIDYLSLDLTLDEASTVFAILAVYQKRGEDDVTHLQDVQSVVRKIGFALGR